MRLYNLAPSISLSFLVYITGTLLASPDAVSATTINTLANFTYSGNNGATPTGGLFEDNSGNLFGTAFYGGTSNNGTIFKYTPGSGLSTLANFNGTNGGNPESGLVVDSLGNFIGTTYDGGTSNKGTVFKYTPGSGISTLVNFNGTNGSTPGSGLLADSVGNLFGTTAGGGTFGYGTLFEYTPGSGISTLASFGGNGSGAYPNGELLKDSSGNLIGTTYSGGTNGNQNGTIFKYTPGSGLSILAEFNGTNGAHPGSGLVSDSQGNLFGIANLGGTSDKGTLFKYTPGSGISTLANFNGVNGANQYNARLALDSQGNLFGTTNSGGTSDKGTVFEYTPGSGLVTLANFNGTNGANPSGGLLEDSQGNLFGTTGGGGGDGLGTVFKLSTNTVTPPANGYQVFFGEDVNTLGDPNVASIHPNSDAARNSFLSNLAGVGIETFEGFSTGTTAPITLTFPGAGTATLTGTAAVRDFTQGGGLFPISGSKYISTRASTSSNTFAINFSQPVAAFGFYATDIGDFGGQLSLVLSNGSTTTLTVPNTIGSNGSTSGSALYYGFYSQNPSEQFTSIQFLDSSTADTFGFDDLTIGSLQQVKPVPEPSEILGTLFFGTIGAGYLLKRQRRHNLTKRTEQY